MARQTANKQVKKAVTRSVKGGGGGAGSDKPNILVIWGDDIGQSNLSCYTHGLMGYRTPNIDRIAREGMLFTDSYGEQSCTARRSSFITGQSVYRTGLSKVGIPAAPIGMNDKLVTIAAVLKEQGYATGQFGKNHLGDLNPMLPTNHGFDEFFGNLYHLNAEEEPEMDNYPKDLRFREHFGPRGVMHTWATNKDDPTVMPRWGRVGKQKIQDTGPLTKKRMRNRKLFLLIVSVCGWANSSAQAQSDPLPSWNEGANKSAIVEFVSRVTREGRADFVPAAERIATFDNDGTLWSEQPIYFQFAFALDRVKELAPQHPEWKTQQPFEAVLEGDLKGLAAAGEQGLAQLLIVTHTGITTDEFSKAVADWLNTAQHPRFKQPYTNLVYRPMLELLAYLRQNGFETFIVSGGTVEFMRVFAERVYGIPPEQVVGSTFVTKFEMGADGKPVLLREPKIDFVNDGPGKPVAIQKFIGRRPILAFGNSDGDQQMLEWTAAGTGARFMGLVHHTDTEREWAYDRESQIGHLDKALDEATERKWVVVDMKLDWKVIYPSQVAAAPASAHP